MTKQELEQLISDNIELDAINNRHGISKENISYYLIEPILKEYNQAWNGARKSYWLVFNELPEDKKDGYQIVYDEEEQSFGLAVKAGMEQNDIGMMPGLYGSFINTLNSM